MVHMFTWCFVNTAHVQFSCDYTETNIPRTFISPSVFLPKYGHRNVLASDDLEREGSYQPHAIIQ